MLIWWIFIFLVIGLLVLDLGVFHRDNKEISFSDSIKLSLFYFIIAILFGFWIWYIKGLNGFAEYVTGFLVEKTLALDNIFLISLIFSALSIPLKYQHRVLFWGILGVIVLRAIMISLGTHIITKFEWVLYLFAIFMIVTGIKMFFMTHQTIDIQKNPLLIWLRKHLNLTKDLRDEKFYVFEPDEKTGKKKLFFTPLFVALIMVEVVDLIFAVDSIPAIFTITKDPYIIYTSNIFAILGLRALYFALASIIKRFHYLKYSLAVVLIFIGSKIFIADALDIEKIPATLSLSFTIIALAAGVVISIKKSKNIP